MAQTEVYIQKWTDKLFTVLDSTPVGNFLINTGMEDVVKGGVSQFQFLLKMRQCKQLEVYLD